MVSAKTNQLEISWFHAKPGVGTILITDEEPIGPFVNYETSTPSPPPANTDAKDIIVSPEPSSTANPDYIDNSDESLRAPVSSKLPSTTWKFGRNNRTALYAIQPDDENGWLTTHIPFDNELSKSVTFHTKCYGFWAIHIDHNNGNNVLAQACISAQPTWMNDMRDHIKNFRFCNLFIVGSHDSGSFRSNYNPHGHDSIVTKYSLTQVQIYTFYLLLLIIPNSMNFMFAYILHKYNIINVYCVATYNLIHV